MRAEVHDEDTASLSNRAPGKDTIGGARNTANGMALAVSGGQGKRTTTS
jgi:hypothetical protein